MGVEGPGPVPAGVSVLNMTTFFSRFPSERERRAAIEEWSALPLVAGAALLRHLPRARTGCMMVAGGARRRQQHQQRVENVGFRGAAGEEGEKRLRERRRPRFRLTPFAGGATLAHSCPTAFPHGESSPHPLVLAGAGGSRQRLPLRRQAARQALRLPAPSLESDQGHPEMRSEGVSGVPRGAAISPCHFAECVYVLCVCVAGAGEWGGVALLSEPAFHRCRVGCAVGGIHTHSSPLPSSPPHQFRPLRTGSWPGACMAPGEARRPQKRALTAS